MATSHTWSAPSFGAWCPVLSMVRIRDAVAGDDFQLRPLSRRRRCGSRGGFDPTGCRMPFWISGISAPRLALPSCACLAATNLAVAEHIDAIAAAAIGDGGAGDEADPADRRA